MSTLTITDDDYQKILTEVGYPIINEADLGVTEDFIKDQLILYPLKNVYFKWFPQNVGVQYSIGSTFEIPFPDSNTFGVVDVRLVPPGSGAGKTGNPLINDMIIKVRSGGGLSKWGTGNDYGYSAVYEMEKSRTQSLISTNKAFRPIINYADRTITGYSNMEGTLSITWAKYSDNFDDVPWKAKDDVIKLAQSSVLQYFGNLRNQSTSDLSTELTGDSFIDRADALYSEVMEKFKGMTKVVIMRN